MTVFKNYFKIVKRHLGTIIMFSAISIGISVINTSYSGTENYVSVEPKLAIINADDSELSDGFVEYLSKHAEIVQVQNNDKAIQDALYLNKADSILFISENFTKDLLAGDEPKIQIKKSTQNISEYTELLVNRYLKLAESYSKVGMSEREIVDCIVKDMENEVDISISNKKQSELQKLAIYFSFENYAFLSIFIFVIGTIMCIFNKETIRKRNFVSKMKPKSFSLQLFLGHITLSLGLWAIFSVISLIIYPNLMIGMHGIFLVLNSLCFTITATSLAYMVGTLIKKESVISGVQNVVSLGLSFISGCFVPLEYLDENVVNFSKLFPSYWFINGNYNIVKISSFTSETIMPVIRNYGVVLVFGAIYFLIVKLIISKGNA